MLCSTFLKIEKINKCLESSFVEHTPFLLLSNNKASRPSYELRLGWESCTQFENFSVNKKNGQKSM